MSPSYLAMDQIYNRKIIHMVYTLVESYFYGLIALSN